VTSEALARLLLYAAAGIDIALGVATLILPRRKLLWLAQIALVLSYTLIITVRLPELWLEPFGSVLKNIPILVALAILYELEER
jgi:hypothetical protein